MAELCCDTGRVLCAIQLYGAYRRFRSRRCYREFCSKIVEIYLPLCMHNIQYEYTMVTMLQKNAQSVHNNIIIIKVMMTETDSGRIPELHRLRQDDSQNKKKNSSPVQLSFVH